MGSLHDHDRSAYADMIFQLSEELSEDSTFESGPEPREKEAADRHLRSIIKLGQTSVIFTVFEDVVKKWLDLLPRHHRQVSLFLSTPCTVSDRTVSLTRCSSVCSTPTKRQKRVAAEV
jgi:hypothetical protein